MNPYTNLQLHLERHMYKRGRNKGEAPADPARRGKNIFRVLRGNDNTMRVRMYSTDLITVYPDNRVVINTNSWWDSSTTKMNLNFACFTFLHWGHLSTSSIMGLSQPEFTARGKGYRYYDGMEFDAEGTLLSEPKPFEMKRIDKEASKELMSEIKTSGFKDLWPVLFATAQPPEREEAVKLAWNSRNFDEIIVDPDRADKWPAIVALHKYPNATSYYRRSIEVDSKTAWASLMHKCKKGMYVTKASDITERAA